MNVDHDSTRHRSTILALDLVPGSPIQQQPYNGVKDPGVPGDSSLMIGALSYP